LAVSFSEKFVGEVTASIVHPGAGLAAWLAPAKEKKQKMTAKTPKVVVFKGELTKAAVIFCFFSLPSIS
jgi:hypothetical protein